MKANEAYIVYRGKLKSRVEDDGFGPMHKPLKIYESNEDILEHLNEKQNF